MTTKRKATATNPRRVIGCPLCGRLLAEHQGIAGTCAKLRIALKALREIENNTGDWYARCIATDALKEAE